MPGLSDTHEASLLNWLFKQTAFPSAPTAMHYSLHDPVSADTGTNELALSGSYQRAQLDPDTDSSTHTNYNSITTSGTAQRISNKLDITFPTATANWNSSNAIDGWGVWTATASAPNTGGTFLASGTITGGVVVLNGNTLKFAGGTPGALTFDVD